MAIALKDLKRELMPGLYPGWRFGLNLTTDTYWIEGPGGYLGTIPRKALEDVGLDGVMEFIVQKDARMKRYPSLRAAMEEYARMCAKGAPDREVTVTEMKAQEEYTKYLALARDAEVIQRGGQDFEAYQPRMVVTSADYQQSPKPAPKPREMTHGQWDGARRIDLD